MEEKRLVIVGTAHVSKRSVDEVLEIIERERPEAVAVELCQRRYRVLVEGVNDEVSVSDVLRGNVFLMLFQVILAYMQRKVGEETGVTPGSEMLAAIKKAREIGADVLLIDRDISVTFRRFWQSLSLLEKIRLVLYLIRDFFSRDSIDVEELVEEDVIEYLVREFRKISPKAAKVLIDERDAYMAAMLNAAMQRYNRVVAIVGAGHRKGIEEILRSGAEVDVAELVEVNEGRNTLRLLGVVIPVLIVGIFVLVAMSVSTEKLLQAFMYWFLINGILAAAGAVLARGHPLSVAAAFFTAWLTSLNPVIAAGWISGLVEAWVRKPGADDVAGMLNAKTLSEMLTNNFFRVLLVAALTNVGSFVGTIYGSYYIMSRFGVDVAKVISEKIASIL